MKYLAACCAIVKKHPLLVFGVTAGLFFIGGATATDEKGLFGQTTAAWVQAVFSIAAIVAAIWVASEGRQHERRESIRRELQAITWALFLAQRALRGFVATVEKHEPISDHTRATLTEVAVERLARLLACQVNDTMATSVVKAHHLAEKGLRTELTWLRKAVSSPAVLSDIRNIADELDPHLDELQRATNTPLEK